MAFILKDSTVKDIANAIREKDGTEELIKVCDLDERILALAKSINLPVDEAGIGDIYVDEDGNVYEYTEDGEWVINETIQITTEAEEGEIGSDTDSGYPEEEMQ